MGIDINIKEKTLAIDAAKLKEIVLACNEAYDETHITKRDLQSLLYISKIIKPEIGFLNQM